ncbi:MAG: hypothetical protein H7281_12855 [Bacteriovorax sp.]|nr:hypothetical protein [Bacteriovorax sp.]
MKWMIFNLTIGLTSSFFFEVHAQTPQTSAKVEFAGQRESVTDWGNLPIESFLSFKEWKEESDIRDQVPEWEKIVRERNHKEIVGRVYQCFGICRVDRGESFFNSTYRTGLYEGDEIQTVGDSYAWIFLNDGTMVRVSPQSSITFNEFNVGSKENFINARVNAGNILWLSRSENTFEETDVRETDVTFFPYSEYESLPVTEKRQYIEDDLIQLVEKTNTDINHYKNLNEKVEANNKMTKGKPTYAFIVMPNSTLMGISPNVEVVALVGGKTFLKKRSSTTLGLTKKEEIPNDLFLQMRGYDNKTLSSVQEDQWIAVEEKGRSYAQAEDVRWLNVGEFITKRIPSIMLGREIFLEKYSEFSFREKYDPVVLARKDGYRLWGAMTSKESEKKSDLELRLEFLKEYFRRVETTNLLASSRFKLRLEERGEKALTMDYGNYFFINALDRYYRAGEELRDKTGDKETGEVLNSTTKLLWKKMNGIR